ncbi:MAG: peptidoglycan DD-metalloendopeptidase family protein, partial [Bifidobacterium pseudocatenulatum]|nr:peptidoglycan DD-metalloendopeptidase family protein [Bifidobacterium pseudocatenulatum]
AIVAPADGVIAFSGNVGGKAVVTIRHGGDLSGLTSTFEPAIAERDVGAHVAQGERFARVEGESDHCDERCLHWGIKSEGRQYTNPESKTRTVRIGLKGL